MTRAVRLSPKNEPTRRSLARLEALGYVADRADSDGRPSRDWCGIIDLIGLRAHPLDGRLTEALCVQVTSASNVAARVRKCRASPQLARILATGAEVEVWGWSPEKPDPRVVPILDPA